MIGALAHRWGRMVGRYSRIVAAGRTEVHYAGTEPACPGIWICWHEANMVAMVSHCMFIRRPAIGVVPTGMTGAAMAGWFEQLGITPMALDGGSDARRGMMKLVRGLRSGHDVLMAVDGPYGPRHEVKPGIVWLAGLSGAPVRPYGAAVARAFRLPRWDRLVIPLPGARIVGYVGPSLHIESRVCDESARRRISRALDDAGARAERALAAGTAAILKEVA